MIKLQGGPWDGVEIGVRDDREWYFFESFIRYNQTRPQAIGLWPGDEDKSAYKRQTITDRRLSLPQSFNIVRATIYKFMGFRNRSRWNAWMEFLQTHHQLNR